MAPAVSAARGPCCVAVALYMVPYAQGDPKGSRRQALPLGRPPSRGQTVVSDYKVPAVKLRLGGGKGLDSKPRLRC